MSALALYEKDPFSFIDKFIDSHFGLNYYRDTDVKVLDNENGYVVHVSAPGLEKDDFSISLEDETLTVEYSEKTSDNKSFFCKSFKKSWKMPKNISLDDVSAKYEQGILSITIPKVEPEKPKRKTVKIE